MLMRCVYVNDPNIIWKGNMLFPRLANLFIFHPPETTPSQKPSRETATWETVSLFHGVLKPLLLSHLTAKTKP